MTWVCKTGIVAKAVKYESEKQKCRWRAQFRGPKSYYLALLCLPNKICLATWRPEANFFSKY